MKIKGQRVIIGRKEYDLLTSPCTYKVLGDNGEALYIGSSGRGACRVFEMTHLRRDLILTAKEIEFEIFETVDEALAAERKAIASLDPRENGSDSIIREKNLIGTKRNCNRCSKIYVVKREWQRFCSDECRNQHWMEGHKKEASV